MSLSMADQAGFLSERLAANVADVRPLASVDQHVLLLSRLSPERLAAHGTRKRLYPRVHPHVRLEIASAESLAAGRTEDLLPGLVPREMLFQVLLRSHAPSTYRTDELRLVMPVLHMRLQRVEVLAEVAAHVAHDWRRAAVILLHVMVQGLLDLELLAAGIARVVVIARVQPDIVVLQSTLVVTLVLAHAALVHLLTMIPLDVSNQVTP